MYNLIIYLYLLGVAIYSRFNEKVRKMWRGERDAFRILLEQVQPGARYVWFHAASLGEFEQGRPLMEQLRREHPELKILLTFFSPSGYEVRKNYEGADIICYLPLDTIRNARRFLRLIRPEMAFFIKYEFWYNYLHILKHRGVPVYSVSSIFRDGQIFFRWYGRQYGRVLKCFTRFFVQNEKSRELLANIGLTNVTITGDTRFDRVLQIKEQAKQLPVVDYFLNPRPQTSNPKPQTSNLKPQTSNLKSYKVFVAGSSWPPDEEIFIRYFRNHPEWKLIIAPHVIAEDHLQQIEKHLEGLKGSRYTALAKSFSNSQILDKKKEVSFSNSQILDKKKEVSFSNSQILDKKKEVSFSNSQILDKKKEVSFSNSQILDQKQILDGLQYLIVDCFGLLSSIYRYATVTYVGGGFGVGIHNTVEAAVWGVPVIFGPNNAKFQEAQALKQCGGGIEIASYEDFERLMDTFAANPQQVMLAGSKAGDYVKSMSGATAKILSDCFATL